MTAAEEPEPLKPGDLCHHGSNLLPTYRVIWLDGDKVWLRDVNTDADAVVAATQCHRLSREGSTDDAPPAAEPEKMMPRGLTWPDGTPRP